VICDARHSARRGSQSSARNVHEARKPRFGGWTHFEYLAAVPTIVLNGEVRELEVGQTLSDLLRELGLDSRQVAVERNREVVPRAQHGTTVLAEGDQLEVVTFVGGG
jgi:sulfur carrier protein